MMLSDKIGLIYTQNCNQQDEIRKKVDEIEMDLKNKLKSFEYVWKVENFAQLQCYTKSAGTEEIVYSDPFYTSEFGYKIRLRLYPNGNGAGKGTHLYVFLQVMKGPHDAILNWPIVWTEKLSILDQLNHKDHHSVTVDSDLIQFKDCYDKPVEEYNRSVGCPLFISLDQLKPLYLVDDTIFVKLDLSFTS
uniref:MATH domain-containing protein n=1 Tax=Strigamia maritima TaxID=126957 RepID=T1IS09_STRMM